MPEAKAARAPAAAGTLGYLYCNGGLNNQKMAFVGLLMQASQTRSALNLPYIHVPDQVTRLEYLARFEDVFDLRPVMAFARAHDVVVRDDCPSGERGGWDFFSHFGAVTAAAAANLTVARALLAAVASLTPRLVASPVFQRLKAFVFASLGVDTVIQLRIERDWQDHVTSTLNPAIGTTDDHGIGFPAILAKVRNTLPDIRLAYVTSEERAMPASKQEIRAFSRRVCGIDLVWKSDFLSRAELDRLNPLDLSIIDYAMALAARRYAGVSLSTFSNMLCLEKFSRSGRPVTGHFIYDAPGDLLRERLDNGLTFGAHNPLLPNALGSLLQGHPTGRGQPSITP